MNLIGQTGSRYSDPVAESGGVRRRVSITVYGSWSPWRPRMSQRGSPGAASLCSDAVSHQPTGSRKCSWSGPRLKSSAVFPVSQEVSSSLYFARGKTAPPPWSRSHGCGWCR